MKKLFFLAGVCVLLLCNCNTFKKVGSNLGDGLSTKSGIIGKNLVTGAGEGFAESTLRADLYKTIDSAIAIAGSSTNRNLKTVLDSLLTKRWSVMVKQLVEDATGRQTRRNMEDLREALIGAKTKADLQALILTVLNDQNTGKLVALKNNLIGDSTNRQVATLVDTAMAHLTSRFQSGIADSTLSKLGYFLDNDLHNSLDRNLNVVQRYATWFLVGIAAVAVLIITMVWLNRQKYLKLSTLLASQVNGISDRKVYDQVTAQIKQTAVTTGVEPTLRSILDKNKLLGAETWKPLPK
jgi:hypothetical protein